MIDFHSHILPQTDDGPFDSAASLDIARAIEREGFSELYCTPHQMKGVYEAAPARIIDRVAELQQLLDKNSIRLKLSSGAEYYLDEYLPTFLAQPLPVAAGCILAEAPLQTTVQHVETFIAKILSSGFTPLIAHPERTPLFSPAPSQQSKGGWLGTLFGKNGKRGENGVSPAVAGLVAIGCRFQGNIGSFAGIYGERARSTALTLLDSGVYSCLGSDAHRPERLAETLQSGLATIRGRIGAAAAARLLSGELLT